MSGAGEAHLSGLQRSDERWFVDDGSPADVGAGTEGVEEGGAE
jgi:hypothetical protein